MSVKVMSQVIWEQDVLQVDGFVLVDFWVEWCGLCCMVVLVLDEIQVDNFDKIIIFKFNVDENLELVMKYQIMLILVMKVFSGGEVKMIIIGVKLKFVLEKDLVVFIG